MDWLVNLIAVLAAPAAGVLGAWFGGRGVVQQAKINADRDRALERASYERSRRDDSESELRRRAEALVLAVAAVRKLPEQRQGVAEAERVARRATRESIYPAYAALIIHSPGLSTAGQSLMREAYESDGEINNGWDRFTTAVSELNAAIIQELADPGIRS